MGSHRNIATVYARKIHRAQPIKHQSDLYPLYTNATLQESFNFSNISRSIEKWHNYSGSVDRNWNQLMSLFETVAMYGTDNQIAHITNIISHNIVPYVESLDILKNDVLVRLVEADDKAKPYLSIINESINECVDADRVLDNMGALSKRFDIPKLVKYNILFEDAFVDTIYALCELVDTYNMNYKEKFCVAAETALYTIFESVDKCDISDSRLKKNLKQRNILETVLDYYIVNYGIEDPRAFLESMREVCHRDGFIKDQLDPYISSMIRIIDESYVDNDGNVQFKSKTNGYDPMRVQTHFVDESVYGLAKDLDQYQVMREELNKLVFKESFEDLADRAANLIGRIKMFPSQAYSAVRQLIAALLVPCRAEDIGKGVHNVLSDIFYVCIVLGFLKVGAVASLLALIISYVVRKCVQKEYLKEAIQEWREHKYSVTRKINDCKDPEKKRRMEAYLMQIEDSLRGMENKYEAMRDKTLAELKKNEDTRKVTTNSELNPSGQITPASAIYDPDQPGMVKVNIKDELKQVKKQYVLDQPSRDDIQDDEGDDF